MERKEEIKMKVRTLIASLLFLLPTLAMADEKGKVRFNAGFKAGFQAVTYNDPEFEIEGYEFDHNNIQSNKIGYAISPFARISKSKFYLQTEVTFGITNHSFDFKDQQPPADGNNASNCIVYDLRTYCIQVPILFGFNFVEHERYGMSIFTGPRTKFIFPSMSDQNFKHFRYRHLEEVLNDKTYYWEFGLGIKISRVFLDITFDVGINKASRHIISHDDGKIFNSSRRDNILSFSVGFLF